MKKEGGKMQASYRLTESNKEDTSGFEEWNSKQLADYLTKAGLGEYSEMFIMHKVTGRLAPLLSDLDLKEMGILVVGDRLRVKTLILALGRSVRYNTRTRTIWEATERIYFSDAEQCCWTCCGLFPDDPSTYKLLTNHLKIKQVTPARCGPIKLCCCFSYSINNIDLSKVNDVDVLGEPAPCCVRLCCCAPGRDLVEIQTLPAGKTVLSLKMGEGERVSMLIMHQVEEAQVIERD